MPKSFAFGNGVFGRRGLVVKVFIMYCLCLPTSHHVLMEYIALSDPIQPSLYKPV